MEAITFTAKEKKLQHVKIPIPKITQPNEILIKVAYSGVCGTDIHIIQGEFPCNQNKALTLGHEFSGIVAEVGPEVSIFKKGDKVSVDPNCGCLCCKSCHLGKPHFCKDRSNRIGTFRDGGWAQYVVIPADQVHKLPDAITLEQAALAEPISCVAHGWDIISPITVGKNILITGAGIIGSLWVCVLHLQGHRKVTVSEPNSIRLNLLKKLDTGFNLITPDQLKKNAEADPTYLFDLVIDCSGFPPAVEYATTLLKSCGKLCLFGVAPPHAKNSLAPFDICMKELTIVGILVNPFSFTNSLGLLESMGNRYLNFEKLGIKIFELKDYKDAMEALNKGTILKAIFKL